MVHRGHQKDARRGCKGAQRSLAPNTRPLVPGNAHGAAVISGRTCAVSLRNMGPSRLWTIKFKGAGFSGPVSQRPRRGDVSLAGSRRRPLLSRLAFKHSADKLGLLQRVAEVALVTQMILANQVQDLHKGPHHGSRRRSAAQDAPPCTAAPA